MLLCFYECVMCFYCFLNVFIVYSMYLLWIVDVYLMCFDSCLCISINTRLLFYVGLITCWCMIDVLYMYLCGVFDGCSMCLWCVFDACFFSSEICWCIVCCNLCYVLMAFREGLPKLWCIVDVFLGMCDVFVLCIRRCVVVFVFCVCVLFYCFEFIVAAFFKYVDVVSMYVW